jgi:hypothetical protein
VVQVGHAGHHQKIIRFPLPNQSVNHPESR